MRKRVALWWKNHPRTLNGLVVATGLVCVLLSNPPAHLLTRPINAVLGQTVQLINPTGSVWRGSTQLVINGPSSSYRIPGGLAWDVSVDARLNVQLTLSHPQFEMPLIFSISRGFLSWNQGTMRLPAHWTNPLGAPWNTLKPEGLLVIDWPAGNTTSDQHIRVVWKDAQSALTSVRPLGEYVVDVTRQSNGLGQLALSTRSGELKLEGTGQWTEKGQWNFNGYAYPSGNQRVALTGLLSQMGRQDGDRYRLSF